MAIIKLNANQASLGYNTKDHKSYLFLDKKRYHVYESRNFFTLIGYILKKYFSSNWKERSINIGSQQYKFLVKTRKLDSFDKKIKKFTALTLNPHNQTAQQTKPLSLKISVNRRFIRKG